MNNTPLADFLVDYPPLLTVKQVAAIFQVTPLTIKRWGKRGILPPIRINSRGDRRYTKEQILWLLGQRQEKQIEPSVNKRLYEVRENIPESPNKIEKKDSLAEKEEDPSLKPSRLRHSF
ncbi:helix-turn-helix domain-containing protein [Patescibacteria group bacterium]|nr:helix-turn-helix domain-containing protein [Patescibacteria group bacterium]MBU1868357.1 helix-turn-helix domain-containing protein [Patescibacteria group bacterium]